MVRYVQISFSQFESTVVLGSISTILKLKPLNYFHYLLFQDSLRLHCGYWACPVHYFTPAVNVPLLYAGLSLDEEVPDYDLDSEDEEWLSLQTDEKVLF